MTLIPLPAFQDNDLWLLHDGHGALVADPGDSQPALACSKQTGLQLEAILVKHHRAGVLHARISAFSCETGRPVEPGNADLVHYTRRCQELRAENPLTLPSTIGREKRINPFLRTRLPAVAQAARAVEGARPQDDVGVFAAIRRWKQEFK